MILRHQPLHIHRPQHHLLAVNRLQSHPSGLLLLHLPSIKLKSFFPSHTPSSFSAPFAPDLSAIASPQAPNTWRKPPSLPLLLLTGRQKYTPSVSLPPLCKKDNRQVHASPPAHIDTLSFHICDIKPPGFPEAFQNSPGSSSVNLLSLPPLSSY